MPGFNQQQLAYKVQNSNAVSIMIGDQLIGFGQTASPSQDFGTDALYGIGTAKPQEIQQLKFSQSLSLDRFKLTSEGLSFFGESTPLATILAYNQFNIFLLDGSGTAFLTYVGCVASNVSTSVTSNAPLTEAISFMAMDVLDADGNSVLDSNSALDINFVASAAGGVSTPTSF